jgi:hypothetical protein
MGGGDLFDSVFFIYSPYLPYIMDYCSCASYSRFGKVDVMKILIDHGANVHAKEVGIGATPLFIGKMRVLFIHHTHM